ncbi:MAG: DUF4097 family beta strand repeat protein [Bryobacterales bacterium]|nr:DUF4097 family beta strand repeat protein [Bryobacterales bacterium]MBV9398774.1 DUF4097 family beta strand repeat protein [Bryobacterales bacterium]
MVLQTVINMLLAGSSAVTPPELKQPVQTTNTEQAAFPSGGLLHMKNATGDVTIEGCDCDDAEITTIKSGKDAADIDKIRVITRTEGRELIITTEFPRHVGFSPIGPAEKFKLEYHIKVPKSAKVDVEHSVGEVHVDDIHGDIRATSRQGELLLHLRENQQYAIDATSDYGAINSDFEGRQKRRPWLFGVRFVQNMPSAPQKIHLHIGYGDIVILKIRVPPIPAPR